MSENEELSETSSDTQILAEYKDGQLQIVEVTPFDKAGDRVLEGNDMPSLDGDGASPKYIQVVNQDKSVMQLDLLNLALVRCEDGSESYRLVSSSEVVGDGSSEGTVTCVLHTSDNEEADNGNAYVVMDSAEPLVLYQSQAQEGGTKVGEGGDTPQKSETRKLTPNEILERAKALQKAKAKIVCPQPRSNRSRKRKSELPPPHELLSSPNFKLFLYSCKSCSFKCNGIKEMSAHKASSPGCGPGGPGRARVRPPAALQCALCEYKGTAHWQLMKHVQEVHKNSTERNTNRVVLDTAEVAAADVLVCGACGYESSSRALFRRHIELMHGATAC